MLWRAAFVALFATVIGFNGDAAGKGPYGEKSQRYIAELTRDLPDDGNIKESVEDKLRQLPFDQLGQLYAVCCTGGECKADGMGEICAKLRR